MQSLMRSCVLGLVVVFAVTVAVPGEVWAKQGQAHHKTTHKKKKSKVVKSTTSSRTAMARQAQAHLINLGFLSGKADGIVGSKTKAALRKFQRANGLDATGQLTQETFDALVAADRAYAKAASGMVPPRAAAQPSADFYALHPDYYGYVHQNYADAFQIGVPAVPSRFARVDVREVELIAGMPMGLRRYDVLLNNAPLFAVDDQPAVIGVSRTYSLVNEDAVIFTAYRPNNLECSYHHYLLVLNATSHKLLDIDNCTFRHTANLVNDVLVISFPEDAAARAAASVWRYDHGDLTKL